MHKVQKATSLLTALGDSSGLCLVALRAAEKLLRDSPPPRLSLALLQSRRQRWRAPFSPWPRSPCLPERPPVARVPRALPPSPSSQTGQGWGCGRDRVQGSLGLGTGDGESGPGLGQGPGRHDSQKELGRGGAVAGGARLPEAGVGEFLALDLVGVSFAGQPGHLLLKLLHLLNELRLLILQVVFLLDAFIPARLGVAPVLQGPPLLFQADHLVLGEAPQVAVQLAHGHGHELVVGEAVLHAAAATRRRRRGCRVRPRPGVAGGQLLRGASSIGRRRRRLVMVVMVLVSVWAQLFVGHAGARVPMMWVWVVVVMVVVRTAEAVEALQGLWHGVRADERLHRILGRQVERLRVHLLVGARHPVQVLQVGLLFGRAEAGRRGHRATGRAERGGRHRAGGLQARAGPARALRAPQRLLLYIELEQVEVVNILHGQRAGGQLGPHAQLRGHR